MSPETYSAILYEPRGPLCFITLNRPDVLNARNDQLVDELTDAWHQFDGDPSLSVAVLSGSGRAFCSGADVRQRQLAIASGSRPMGGRPNEREGLPQMVNWKPVVAAVHGYALGAGLELMLACDVAVAATGTVFELTEVKRGLGGSQVWAAMVFAGAGRFAHEIALTGRRFTAEEAMNHGLLNRVVPENQLMAAAQGLAEEIAANPPLSVRCNARVIRHNLATKMRESNYFQQGLRLHFSKEFADSAQAFARSRDDRKIPEQSELPASRVKMEETDE